MTINHKTVLFVTGKGGVGKTEVAVRLAQHSASIGNQTLLVEVNGSSSLNPRFNISQSYDLTSIGPHLSTLSITPEEAIREYALKQLKFNRLYKLIFENRYVKPLVHGAPGLHDAVQLGKIYDLHESGHYDLIIIDAPATGHCLTMLESAKTMMDLTRFGPMFDSNALVENLIGDASQTSILLTTTLEELPTIETIELYEKLSDSRRRQVLACIANKVKSAPISTSDWNEAINDMSSEMAPWVEQTTWMIEKTRQEHINLEKMIKNLNVNVLQLPLLDATTEDYDLSEVWDALWGER